MRRKKSDTKGSTMVEVMMAFLIVMLLLATFSSVLSSSTTLTRRSLELSRQNQAFEEEYYKGTGRSHLSGKLILDGEGMKIPLTKGYVSRFTSGTASRYTVEASGNGG